MNDQPSKVTPFTLFALSLFLVLLRTLLVMHSIWHSRRGLKSRGKRKGAVRTLIILGSGGHTTEILAMTRPLNRSRYNPIYYCKASTDTTSALRLNDPSAMVYNIPRSREVGQSYFTSTWTTLYAQLHAFWLIARLRPDLVICNGPGTCLPICVAAFCFRLIGVCPGQVVFVESYCRVETLSLTGTLLYYWADLFIVHWRELQARYPDSHLISSFVGRQ